MSKRCASLTSPMTDRAGSRRRMDSPASRYDSSPDPGSRSKQDVAAPIPYAYASPSPIGPASSVSEDDLVEWRQKYSLPSSFILRVPSPEDRVSNFIPGQIAVYEAFFDHGFRGVIPSLIETLCEFFEISPSQLNPPSWRLLLAIQNIGNLENLSFGVKEVLYSYHLAPLNGNEGRLHLRPRSGLPIVEELSRSDRKESAFIKKWQERYVFMALPGHSYHWNFIAGMHPDIPEGVDIVVRARQLPLDRRQVSFLLSDTALRRSSPRGNLAAALSNLNLQVFPLDGTTLPLGKPLEVIQVLQGGLLRNISQLYHLGEQLSLESSSISREELEKLKNQLSEEKTQHVARELEIRDLKDTIKDVERSAEISSADALSVGKKNQELEEAMENLRLETVMAVSGAIITALWELMREWLQRKNDQ
uniref:Uncharacterized protein n=1 Tax=Brassica campestris TaxID=3711 RepID=M4FIX0_BRACM